VIGAGGLAAAATVWAYNQRQDPALIAKTIEAALAKIPPLKIEPITGRVTMEDGKVALKDGATVNLNPDAQVIARGTLTVDQLDTTTRHELDSVTRDFNKYPPKTDDGLSITREVTVFTTVNIPLSTNHAQVVTGWQFPNGKEGTPTAQYCYYSTINPDNSLLQYDLGFNGTASPVEHTPRDKVPNFDDQFKLCSWFPT
jgi:hypothetical protein